MASAQPLNLAQRHCHPLSVPSSLGPVSPSIAQGTQKLSLSQSCELGFLAVTGDKELCKSQMNESQTPRQGISPN